MHNFTQDLKQGDSVIVRGSIGVMRSTIATVERVTKTQLILDSGLRFRRDGGRRIGGSKWDTLILIKATDDRIAKIKHDTEHRNFVYKFENTDWRKMSLDKLRKVYSAINEQSSEEK